MDESRTKSFEIIDICYTVVFFLDMIAAFFVDERTSFVVIEDEFADEQVNKDTGRWNRIGRFIFDSATIIPLRQILKIVFRLNGELQLTLLIKVLRVYHGFKFLNYKTYIKDLKDL